VTNFADGTLGELWRYRGLVLGLARREFQLRYLNSVLGSAWAVLQPLTMIALLTLVFGGFMPRSVAGTAEPLAYARFLCVGVIVWQLFAEVVSRCTGVFVEHGHLLKRMRFPRLALPVVVAVTAAINFAIVFALVAMPFWTAKSPAVLMSVSARSSITTA